jgi:hypothetical protein
VIDRFDELGSNEIEGAAKLVAAFKRPHVRQRQPSRRGRSPARVGPARSYRDIETCPIVTVPGEVYDGIGFPVEDPTAPGHRSGQQVAGHGAPSGASAARRWFASTHLLPPRMSS